MTRALQRALWAAAATALLGAAILWFQPVRLGVRSAAPLAIVLASTEAIDTIATLNAEDIAISNIFSTTRTPPSKRFAPSVGTPNAPEEDSTERAPVTGPRLLGTVVQGAESRALMLLDQNEGAMLYRVGDRAGGFRVSAIEARSVTLVGPRGRVTLRLDQEEHRP